MRALITALIVCLATPTHGEPCTEARSIMVGSEAPCSGILTSTKQVRELLGALDDLEQCKDDNSSVTRQLAITEEKVEYLEEVVVTERKAHLATAKPGFDWEAFGIGAGVGAAVVATVAALLVIQR
jgi:hypothetical protein